MKRRRCQGVKAEGQRKVDGRNEKLTARSESQGLNKQSWQPPAAARLDRGVSVGNKREHVEDIVTKLEAMNKTFETPEWGWKPDGGGEGDGG
jgi:hypothetical protein